MSMGTRILVIGINYGTDALALQFSERLIGLSAGQESLAVMLVDNTERQPEKAFTDLFGDKKKEHFYLKPDRNLGYLGGARLGLDKYLETNALPAWVVVSNVDIEFRDEDFFSCLEHYEHDEHLGMVAPSIWSDRCRRDINPKMTKRPRRSRMRFYRYLFANQSAANMYMLASRSKMIINRHVETMLSLINKSTTVSADLDSGTGCSAVRTIYAPHGSCMVFSERYFISGGSFDYPQFLFNEEIFVAETAQRLGLRIVYEPRLKVRHFEHVSTGIIRSREVAAYAAASAKYVFEEYFE